MRCPTCRQEIKLDLTDTKDLSRLIENEYDWMDLWYIGDAGKVLEPGEGRTVSITEGVTIELIYAGAAKIGENYYGGDDIMILFVYNGETYKKTGCYDSYDGAQWSGDLTKAKQVTKTITVWE